MFNIILTARSLSLPVNVVVALVLDLDLEAATVRVLEAATVPVLEAVPVLDLALGVVLAPLRLAAVR
jgi:hypothetical protein